MTRRASPSLPGRVLLTLSKRLFDEYVVTTIIMPVIADLQREVADAGDDRTRRRHARRRGYLAYWRVVMTVVFTIPTSSEGPLRSLLLGRSGGNLLIAAGIALLSAILPVFGWFAAAVIAAGVLVAIGLRRWNDRHTGSRGAVEPLVWIPALALFAAIWPMFGWFVVAVVVSGAVAAIALRRWNTRHPSAIAPLDPLAGRPGAQINLSAIPVAGDFGGLMFVVGSIAIVLLGFPDVRWFVLGSIAAGSVMAVGLFAWRSTHLDRVPPAVSFRGR